MSFGFPADKLTRIVGVQWAGDVEFIVITVSLTERFDVDIETDEDGNVVNVGPAFGDVGHGAGCIGTDREGTDGDRFNWLKRLRYLFNRGLSADGYAINEETDEGEWGTIVGSADSEDMALIECSPDYPVLTSHAFSDWMYLALEEGSQDWYHEFAPQTGNIIRDSNDDVVISPLIGVPFRSGNSTIRTLNATRFDIAPLCLDLGEAGDNGTLGGATVGREIAHSITVSWNNLSATFDEDIVPGIWVPVGFAVSSEHNTGSIQILLAPEEAA